MLGWEFPPYFTGGVGIVCHSLIKALVDKGHDVTFLMPRGPEALKASNPFTKIRIADNEKQLPIRVREVDSLLRAPYDGHENYEERYNEYMNILNTQGATGTMYGQNLLQEVARFAAQAAIIAKTEDFDVIHAHDWVTFQAGLAIKKATGKPLVVHVHITEFDKSGGEHADSRIYALERQGMMGADRVIAVSEFVKRRCVENYYIPSEKIRVVYNSVDFEEETLRVKKEIIKPHDKIILFLGRVTLQKGPEYFLEAAKKVSEFDDNIKFILAGSGDMLPRMIEKAADLGIGNKVLFPGFTSQQQTSELMKAADVFVMPSVSEPYGIVPLEAMSQGTPTIISRQSGVSEVLANTLKSDFWDINDLASKMLAAIHYKVMHETLSEHGLIELKGFSWETPAIDCERIYKELGVQ